MSSGDEGVGRPSFLSRRLYLNLALVGVFIVFLAGAMYYLTSGDVEKRLGRTRMLEDLKASQNEETSKAIVGFDVTPLVDGEYFLSLLQDLEHARSSIDVLMFEIKLGKSEANPANRLVNALALARERGLAVRVRLEQSDMDKSLTRINRRTAEFLKAHSIHVEFDLPDVETHAKAILIDGRLLYVGNHNWSESALTENKEVSFRVESPKSITAMRRYFDRFDQGLDLQRMGPGG